MYVLWTLIRSMNINAFISVHVHCVFHLWLLLLVCTSLLEYYVIRKEVTNQLPLQRPQLLFFWSNGGYLNVYHVPNRSHLWAMRRICSSLCCRRFFLRWTMEDKLHSIAWFCSNGGKPVWESNPRKPITKHCPYPQIPLWQTGIRTRVTSVESRRSSHWVTVLSRRYCDSQVKRMVHVLSFLNIFSHIYLHVRKLLRIGCNRKPKLIPDWEEYFIIVFFFFGAVICDISDGQGM